MCKWRAVYHMKCKHTVQKPVLCPGAEERGDLCEDWDDLSNDVESANRNNRPYTPVNATERCPECTLLRKTKRADKKRQRKKKKDDKDKRDRESKEMKTGSGKGVSVASGLEKQVEAEMAV